MAGAGDTFLCSGRHGLIDELPANGRPRPRDWLGGGDTRGAPVSTCRLGEYRRAHRRHRQSSRFFPRYHGFGDDPRRARTDHAAQDFAVLRQFVLNLLRTASVKRQRGLPVQRLIAATSDTLRAQRLGLVQDSCTRRAGENPPVVACLRRSRRQWPRLDGARQAPDIVLRGSGCLRWRRRSGQSFAGIPRRWPVHRIRPPGRTARSGQ